MTHQVFSLPFMIAPWVLVEKYFAKSHLINTRRIKCQPSHCWSNDWSIMLAKQLVSEMSIGKMFFDKRCGTVAMTHLGFYLFFDIVPCLLFKNHFYKSHLSDTQRIKSWPSTCWSNDWSIMSAKQLVSEMSVGQMVFGKIMGNHWGETSRILPFLWDGSMAFGLKPFCQKSFEPHTV